MLVTTTTVAGMTTSTTATMIRSSVPTVATTTAPLNCHNSTDRRCGPFHWVGIVNHPATVEASITTPVPLKAGADISIHVHLTDPDSILACAYTSFRSAPSGATLPNPYTFPVSSSLQTDCPYQGDCAPIPVQGGAWGPWWIPPPGSTDLQSDFTIPGSGIVAGHYSLTIATATAGCASLVGEEADPTVTADRRDDVSCGASA